MIYQGYYGSNDFRDYRGLYLAHHGIKDQKWGVKNGPPYPIKETILTESVYDNAKKSATKIQKDLSFAVSRTNAKMYGLEHRLKTKDSISRKIAKNAKEDHISFAEAAYKIKDAVRFTVISKDSDFVLNYKLIKKNLESKGYKETRCKNYFDLFRQGKVKHKSVQCNYATKDGYEFEIQFHTPSSQDVKNKKIPLYEERRSSNVSKKRAEELEKQMEDLALSIKDPKDIYKIKSH